MISTKHARLIDTYNNSDMALEIAHSNTAKRNEHRQRANGSSIAVTSNKYTDRMISPLLEDQPNIHRHQAIHANGLESGHRSGTKSAETIRTKQFPMLFSSPDNGSPEPMHNAYLDNAANSAVRQVPPFRQRSNQVTTATPLSRNNIQRDNNTSSTTVDQLSDSRHSAPVMTRRSTKYPHTSHGNHGHENHNGSATNNSQLPEPPKLTSRQRVTQEAPLDSINSSTNFSTITGTYSTPTHHMGASDRLGVQRWNGSLSAVGGPITQKQPVDAGKQMAYGPTQGDGSKNYSRLDRISSLVPMGSLSPLTNRINQDNASPIPVNLAAGSPGFPKSNDSMRSHSTALTGSVLTFHHITYEVKLKKMPWSKAVSKTVLHDVSGILRPGINAIMGPTGSGKSSLLDVLAGRKDPRFLTGQVLVDGLPQPKNFKCISGYVVQDDIVMGTLTVRENLNFSAALRMTIQCSKKERKQKVNDIIDELGLTTVADSKIGTDLIRGVSGGERKRTNIGMELITDPPVLFLDEPTTGLDAFMAGQVIKTLKNLSHRGRTIIFSIHQPKYSIYKLFDSLTLIFRGRLVYHGPAKHEPIRYFNNLGYICENHNNPPDFFMDILHGEATQRPVTETDTNGNLEEPEQIHLVGERLVHEWDESRERQKIQREVDEVTNRVQLQTAGSMRPEKNMADVSYAVPYVRQLQQVCWRTSVNLLRDPLASVVQTLVYLFFALSMGTVYFQMNTSLESGIQNRAGLFFFTTLQVVFVNLGSIELFIKERVLFIHENSSGYYRISAYFLSKILCDILPTKVLPVLIFMPILYWMAGLVPDISAFLFFELILSLTTLAAAAIALFISASFTLFGIANVLLSIVYVFMMVFGGYLINLKSMAVWLSWIRYFSIFRYSLSGLLVTEMPTLEFCPTTNTSVPGQPDNRKCQSGTLYLNDQDIPYQTPWDLWYNALGQTLITIFFYILCYVQLRRIKKYK